MNEAVVIDRDNLYADVEFILQELRVIRNYPSFASILGDGINNIIDWETLLKKRLKEPFNIIIIGDFKRGKSTLVNALLCAYIVPTNVLPETATINKISYGEDNHCVAVLKHGKKAILDINGLNRNELDKTITKLPSEINYIELSIKNDLLKDIAIIDTPGIGDIFEKYDEQVSDYIKNADAVINVVSAKSPLSQTEQNFISAVVLPQSFSRLFIVLNMADSLENVNDIEKLLTYTREKIEAIAPNTSVYALSALDEYCRIMSLDRPVETLNSYLENNFEYFRTSLQNDIIMQKDTIQSMRVLTLTNYMLDDIINNISLLLGVVSSDIKDLSHLEQQYNNENSALFKKIKKEVASISLDIDEMYYEANTWMLEFMDRIQTEIKSIKGKADTSLLQKHFQFI